MKPINYCCLLIRTQIVALAAGLGALLALPAPGWTGRGAVPAAPPAADPRLAAWSSLYLQGHTAQALTSVESDLRSAAPEPDAAAVWVALETNSGQLQSRWASLTDSALRRALGDLPDIALRYQKGDYAALLADNPPGRPGLTFWEAELLSDAADSLAREQDAYSYTILMERERPDDFLCVWDLLGYARNDGRVWSQLMARVQTGGDLARTPAGQALRVIMSVRPVSTQSLIAGVRLWLQAHPQDTYALKFLATQYVALSRYQEAAGLFEQSTQAYPFNILSNGCRNWEDEAKAFIHDGQPNEAAKVVHGSAVADSPRPAGVDLLDTQRMAQADFDAGEKGAARRALEAALRRFPSDATLQDLEAQLDLASGTTRYAYAVQEAQAATEAAPQNEAFQRHLISALDKSGQTDRAWSRWQAVRPRFPLPSQDFYYQGGDLLDRLKRPGDEVTLYEEAVQAYPGSTWMLENAADALETDGRPADALKQFTVSLAIDADNAWVVAQIRKCQDEVDAAKTTQVLAALRQQYPWAVALWADAADHQADADAKVALWRQAAALNPDAYWPWDSAANALYVAGQVDEARVLAAEARKSLQAADSPDAVGPLNDQVWGVIRAINAGSATADDEQGALADLEQFRSGFGSVEVYQQYRTRILQALGRPKEAWQAALADAQLAPDDSDAVTELFNGSFDDHGQSVATGRMAQVACYVDRDPYDGARLSLAAQFHIRWGGSPIIGYELEQLCDQRDPDHADSSLTADAEGDLGDVAAEYQGIYADHTSGIAASDRYVQWFDSARLKAEQAQTQGATVRIDPPGQPPHTAQITLTDGTVELRRDNPLSGKPERVQVGPAWVELRYDAVTGENLESIRDSSGARILLTYDALNRIVTLSTARGVQIAFQYNSHDKPTQITLVGVGSIHVTYTADDQIAKVTSVGGAGVAGAVTDGFQKLLDAIQPFQDLQGGSVPELPFTDPVHDRLADAMDLARATYEAHPAPALRLAAARAEITFARYLLAHLPDRRVRATEAHDVLLAVFSQAVAAPRDAALQAYGAQTLPLWYQLMQQTRPNGLSLSDWQTWARMQEWADEHRSQPAVAVSLVGVDQQLDAKPLGLLDAAKWLPDSYLSIEGYWRRIDLDGLAPRTLPVVPNPTTVLLRHDGSEVIGTDEGLIVRAGYWRWLAYDAAAGGFSGDVSPSDVVASSRINALAEDAGGSLWVGTADGLFRVSSAVEGPATRWGVGPSGLPVAGVDSLAAAGPSVYVGTSGGLRVVSGDALLPVPGLPGHEAVRFLHGPSDPTDGTAPVLVGLADGVYAVRGGRASRLSDPADDALWSPSRKRLFTLRNGVVSGADWDGGPVGPARFLPDQQDIRKVAQTFGLQEMSVGPHEMGLAVLTDLGLSLYKDDHFEFLKLPLADSDAEARQVSTRGGSSLVRSGNAVYAVDQGRVSGDDRGYVYDLLSADDWGLTFVARGADGLEVVRQDDPAAGAQSFDSINATHLARLPDGRVIANDGTNIVAYGKGDTSATVLFNAAPTDPDNMDTTGVTSILGASDGTLWVTSGSSVFRYRNGTVKEYGTFVDQSLFPGDSEMISRVVETTDHQILVVASNEGHIQYKGQPLSGGLLEWDGDRFKRVALDYNTNTSLWFMTGYTPLDATSAIVGTSDAFVEEKDGQLATYPTLQDASYDQLSARVPQLWLGTNGARLGEKTWLFGCAGGLVAYREGQWFYPDRVNWMLPDQNLAAYGARCVHAVATDAQGRIYAGTDRGLMIYDAGGEDDFMLTNDRPNLAFTAQEQGRLRQEASVLLGSLNPDSAVAKQVQQVVAGDAEIAALKSQIAQGVSARMETPPSVTGGPAAPPVGTPTTPASPQAGGGGAPSDQHLADLLDQKQAAQTKLLLQIQDDNPSLAQMLRTDPLELDAERGRLADGQAVLQFLPTRTTLYIQVLTRTTSQVRQVDVSEDDLMHRAREAVYGLAASGVNRGIMLDDPGAGQITAALTQAGLTDDLSWLYDRLLRPVEGDLSGCREVFVVPVSSLSYLPFAALIRSTQPQVEYAVQRYTFGCLPDLYYLDLFGLPRPAGAHDALVLGNPAGSNLPGAEQEARDVQSILGGATPPLIGPDATYRNLTRLAPRARYLHLATHGILNGEHPEQSYLLLADGYRLDMGDICCMQDTLGGVDLAVLSACQTGLGRDGLEYQTLARAFTMAGVPTVMATLWPISDAKTPELMRRFYTHIVAGDDHLTALADAQREMIAETQAQEEPGAWSGFILFGKP